MLTTQNAAKAPKFVYRYLHDEEHAQAFLRGDIWISTLEHVRRCEAARADLEDATQDYRVSFLTDATPPQDAQIMRQRLEPVFGSLLQGKNVRIFGVAVNFIHPDAHVLCTSKWGDSPLLRRVFGRHCIRIAEPGRFFAMLTRAMHRVGNCYPECQDVIYSGRQLFDAEQGHGPVAFVSTERLAREQEVRMLWTPASSPTQPLSGLLLKVPEAAALCRMV